MDDPHFSSRDAIWGLSSFIFIGLLLISIKPMDKYPIDVLGYSIVLFLMGASALIFTSIQLKRLRPIYDYKPIAFGVEQPMAEKSEILSLGSIS